MIAPTPENPTPAGWYMKQCRNTLHGIDGPYTEAYPLIMYVARHGEERECPLCEAMAQNELLKMQLEEVTGEDS